MLHGIFISTLTVLIRKSALIKIGGFQKIPGGITAVDYPTIFVLAFEGTFSFVPHALGYWRFYGGNASAVHGCKMTLTMIEDLLRRLPSYRRLVKANALRRAARDWDNSLALFYTLLGRMSLRAGDFSRARFWFSKLFQSSRLAHRIRANLFLAASLLGLKKSIEAVYKITGILRLNGFRRKNLMERGF